MTRIHWSSHSFWNLSKGKYQCRFFFVPAVSAELRMWINEVAGTQTFPALFTLVAIGIWIAAIRTGSYNVSVGQKHLRAFVVVLFTFFFGENIFLLYRVVKNQPLFHDEFFRSAMVNVKAGFKVAKTLFDDWVIFIHYFLRVIPSFVHAKVIGTPCSSEPQMNLTSSPLARRNLA